MAQFSKLHPAVNLTYFILMLATAMFLSHPAVQLTGLLLSAAFARCCLNRREFFQRLKWVLPLMLLTAVLNPLVTHQGVTVLFWFPSGNACTLEAVLYGLSASVRLVTVLFWFVGWNRILTSDKFVYLFGKVIPSLALTISMGLRLVPRLLGRIREVSAAQKCLCPEQKGLRHAGRVVSIVVTWALENALDTADSMKSRGYGLPGRTAFSIFRFTKQDGMLLLMMLPGLTVILAAAFGLLSWDYYPTPHGSWTSLSAVLTVCFAFTAALPLILEGKEALQWRALKSKI